MAIQLSCSCDTASGKINAECERCRLYFLVNAVARMRQLQREYFKKPSREKLDAAKDAESLVDRTLERLLEVQPELFGPESEG